MQILHLKILSIGKEPLSGSDIHFWKNFYKTDAG